MKHESWLMVVAIAIVLFLTSIFIVRTCYVPKEPVSIEKLLGLPGETK